MLILGTVAACLPQSRAQQTPDPTAANTGSSPVEDIFILRSLRVERSPPGDFCAPSKIGFTAGVQDRYVFKAVVTRPEDGKVIDAVTHPAGTLQACFDGAPGIGDRDFYAEGVLAGIAATGKGKCTGIATDYPEPGIISTRCFLVLTHLAPPYLAGVLTTNSITSRNPIGPESNPPGYIQPSIATIRLWRKH
jgi:hypothetical protein